jgi:hypothetical protein
MSSAAFFSYLINTFSDHVILSNDSLLAIFTNHLPTIIQLCIEKLSIFFNSKNFSDKINEEQLIEFDDKVNVSLRIYSIQILQLLAEKFPEITFINCQQSLEEGLNSDDSTQK